MPGELSKKFWSKWTNKSSDVYAASDEFSTALTSKTYKQVVAMSCMQEYHTIYHHWLCQLSKFSISTNFTFKVTNFNDLIYNRWNYDNYIN